jgi:hypothetical protein
MDPQNIAKLICLVADTTLSGKTSMETNHRLNGALWNLAHKLGCEVEVDRILQDTSVEEMMEAMKGQGVTNA